MGAAQDPVGGEQGGFGQRVRGVITRAHLHHSAHAPEESYDGVEFGEVDRQFKISSLSLSLWQRF
jgi:hypothetical protein